MSQKKVADILGKKEKKGLKARTGIAAAVLSICLDLSSPKLFQLGFLENF